VVTQNGQQRSGDEDDSASSDNAMSDTLQRFADLIEGVAGAVGAVAEGVERAIRSGLRQVETRRRYAALGELGTYFELLEDLRFSPSGVRYEISGFLENPSEKRYRAVLRALDAAAQRLGEADRTFRKGAVPFLRPSTLPVTTEAQKQALSMAREIVGAKRRLWTMVGDEFQVAAVLHACQEKTPEERARVLQEFNAIFNSVNARIDKAAAAVAAGLSQQYDHLSKELGERH